MSSASINSKCCYTCEYFGNASTRKVNGTQVIWDNSKPHVCTISGRGNGQQSPSNSACGKYKQATK